MSTEDRMPHIFLCHSQELVDSGLAVPFEVRYYAQNCAAFAVRYQGRVHAYLNRSRPVPMATVYQPHQFFYSSGHWLVCATHGAMYAPESGHCRMGPCRGGLIKIELSEVDGRVHWHTSDKLQSAIANE